MALGAVQGTYGDISLKKTDMVATYSLAPRECRLGGVVYPVRIEDKSLLSLLLSAGCIQEVEDLGFRVL